ncbi:MAG: hypothetical protein ACPGLV_18745 [Bacteroidia bacterium]
MRSKFSIILFLLLHTALILTCIVDLVPLFEAELLEIELDNEEQELFNDLEPSNAQLIANHLNQLFINNKGDLQMEHLIGYQPKIPVPPPEQRLSL